MHIEVPDFRDDIAVPVPAGVRVDLAELGPETVGAGGGDGQKGERDAIASATAKSFGGGIVAFRLVGKVEAVFAKDGGDDLPESRLPIGGVVDVGGKEGAHLVIERQQLPVVRGKHEGRRLHGCRRRRRLGGRLAAREAGGAQNDRHAARPADQRTKPGARRGATRPSAEAAIRGRRPKGGWQAG